MTLAWYGHLKFKSVPLVTVVLVSWGIAFVEYCFAVPANRIGSAVFRRRSSRRFRRVITLLIFAGFRAVYFKEPTRPDAGRGLRADRAWRDAGVPRPDVGGNGCFDLKRFGSRPPDRLPTALWLR